MSCDTQTNIVFYKGYDSIYDTINESNWKTKNEGYDYEQGYGSCDFVFDVHLFNCNFCEYFNKEEK